jgi:hypothetical protein
LQGLGAIAIASGFAFPVAHARPTGAAVRLAPAIGRTSYGLSALGAF